MNIAAGTPLWPAEWTAVGTMLLAAVTVAAIVTTIVITRQDRKRADKRLAEERATHNKEIAEERRLAAQRMTAELEAAEARLTAQMAHSDDQMRQERDAATARLQEERDLALKREQHEQAVAVHVTETRITPEAWGSQKATVPNVAIACPVAIVLNRGRYTITRLTAQLCVNGNSLLPYSRPELFSSVGTLPKEITAGLADGGRVLWGDTLRPTDIGMRFSSDAMTVRDLYGSYAIVRWRDGWGTWWEHKHGEVREIAENEPWNP